MFYIFNVTRLEIISGETSDTMTGQIHFNSVTYRFWPVKFMRQITLKTRAKKQLWVQIFRGVEGPRNLLKNLSNTCRYNIIWNLSRLLGMLIAVNFIPTTSEQHSKTTRHKLCWGQLGTSHDVLKSFATGSFLETLTEAMFT